MNKEKMTNTEVSKLLNKLDTLEEQIIEKQYAKWATKIVVERCDAQLMLINDLRKFIKGIELV